MFKHIVSKANDVIMVAEITPGEIGHRIVYVNEAFTRTFGYAFGEIVGKSPRVLNGPDTDNDTIQRVSESIHAGYDVRQKVLNYTKYGSPVWMEVNIVPMPGPDGRYSRFAAIERDVTAQVLREKELMQQATTDPLTKLLNRRAFGGLLQTEIERAEQASAPLAYATFDLDRFKAINDSHGHDAGDCVLTRFAELIAGAKLSSHHAARTGGEEFSLLCPDTSEIQAKNLVEDILRRLRSAAISISTETQIYVTCSAGVTALIPFSDSAISLAIRADNALYCAKRAGRDQVVLAGSDNPTFALAS